MNPKPCKKSNGFLSIEKPQDQESKFLVFRSFTGQIQFKGILAQGSAKVKPLDVTVDDKNQREKHKAKFTVVVNAKNESGEEDAKKGKYAVEYCEVRFLIKPDLEAFMDMYRDVCQLKKE